MAVEVEMVDAPLDYNLLPGHNWTYYMTVVVSSMFRVLCFPHEGKVVTIYQLSFTCSSFSALVGPSVPIIEIYQKETKNIGVGMYPSLMGTFNFSEPISYINAIFDESSS
jgi:hypothetical protein